MYRIARSTIAVLALARVAMGVRSSKADTHVVSKPASQDASLPTKMLILIPGSNVPNQHYSKVAKSIQDAATSLNLWVVIPGVSGRRCDGFWTCRGPGNCQGLNRQVQQALDSAENQGWVRGSPDKDIFLGGHGVGGVCANTLFQAYDQEELKPYAGLVLLGSYVDDKGSSYSLANYSVPVLTLNAELDGTKARAAKTAYFWRQHLDFAASDGSAAAIKSKPVVLLPDLSASSFSPGHAVQQDLVAEVSESNALASIGSVAAAFLHLNVASAAASEAAAVMGEALTWTRTFMGQWEAAQTLEWTPTNIAAEGANGYSPFCTEMQKIISGLGKTDLSRIAIKDGFHETRAAFMSCHTESVESGEQVEVETCSHTDYYKSTDESAASKQVACKMWGAEKMGQLLRTSTDTGVTCIDGNKMTVQMVEALALPRTLERFKKRGRGFCFERDERILIGPQWVQLSSVRIRTKSNCMSVRSPMLITDIDGYIYPGVQYCKYLSPTRVLEWMMTDSLKLG